MSAEVGFALAAALHAGFQLAATLLVYPALAARDAGEWRIAHARHSRAITPLVGVVYLALVLSGAALVVAGPGAVGWLALVASAGALAVTAGLAAPLHGRLGSRDATLVGRLLVVDRGRCALAVVGALAAAVGAA